MVTVEYLVDPARAAEFAQVMEATRSARLRQGALSWGLFRDTSVPGRYVEYFVDETGSSTCDGTSASRRPTPTCGRVAWPSTSAKRHRRCGATSPRASPKHRRCCSDALGGGSSR
jgi:hypothetical protein